MVQRQDALKYAWHYTFGIRMVEIRQTRELRPATAYVPQGEVPIVWFSAREQWEPTANKSLQYPDGRIVHLGSEESIWRGEGGWRLGLPITQLLPWKQLKDAARISKQMAAGLVRSAKKSGADPAFWYGSLKPVPIDICVIERLDGSNWIAGA